MIYSGPDPVQVNTYLSICRTKWLFDENTILFHNELIFFDAIDLNIIGECKSIVKKCSQYIFLEFSFSIFDAIHLYMVHSINWKSTCKKFTLAFASSFFCLEWWYASKIITATWKKLNQNSISYYSKTIW